MKASALIFDIYKTLIEVGPPPADAGARWTALCEATLGRPGPIGLEEFARRCDSVIAREHAAARAVGVQFPEIFWPDVACEAFAPLQALAREALDDFLFRHAQLQRTLRLMRGAGAVLRELVERRVPLGLISNSQPYTLRELDAALKDAGLERSLFRPDLTFLSFQHGFSKPNPHAFRILAIRLAAIGISVSETLVVGDRMDNDIEPARAQGWQTWQLRTGDAISGNETAGDWEQFAEWFFRG